MKTPLLIVLLAVVVLVSMTAWAQMTPRTDAIWARITSSPITLDGKLTEPAWAVAESINVHYGASSAMPGGGWTIEDATHPPSDPTDATVKFLAQGESLYVAIICRDKSVGAGFFNAFDGFLMNMRYRQALTGVPSPFISWQTDQSCEIFYAWCKETWADTTTAFVGALPAFLGAVAPSPYMHPRPDSLRTIYDAATFVQGTTNDDSTPDTSWTTEFKINTSDFGYDIAGPNGDIVMWSVDIYDGDWEWPLDTSKVSHNHTWVQDPWSNQALYDHMRIWVRPDVTTSSGVVPAIPPDLTIPKSIYPAPAMDGTLNAAVWRDPNIGMLQIQYNNTTLRNGYPYTAKWRSGQAASTVNGSNTQAVIDPNLVTVKYFFMADTLFLGFDVKDQVVQAYTPKMDPSNWSSRADGIRVTITDRQTTESDYHALVSRVLTFVVDTNGQAYRAEDLEQRAGVWDSSGQAVQVALALRGETKLDTLGRTTADSGYTGEMKVVLTKLGYPAGRGDGVVLLGIDALDGDSFSDPSFSYGNQTWFMKQGINKTGRSGQDDGPAWCYMDPSVVLGVAPVAHSLPARFSLLGNYPNPFNPSTTIKFVMPQASEVTLEVFNILGQLVRSQSLGVRQPGDQTVQFNASTLATGMYAYRLTMASTHSTVVGKMMLLK